MQLDDDLLRAIGNLALVFAALDLSLAHVLSETSSGKIDFSKACEMSLGRKLDRIDSLQNNAPVQEIPTARIRELSHARNDIMHGMVFVFAACEKIDSFTIWNPAHNHARQVSTDEVDKIAAETQTIMIGIDVQAAIRAMRL